jgi:hypothetical protein
VNEPDLVAALEPAVEALEKLSWFRSGGEVSENQWKDIRGVLQVQRAVLNIGYLRRWARELGTGDLLEKALRQADLPG